MHSLLSVNGNFINSNFYDEEIKMKLKINDVIKKPGKSAKLFTVVQKFRHLKQGYLIIATLKNGQLVEGFHKDEKFEFVGKQADFKKRLGEKYV